ncbi:MAG: hypothetical protein AB1Z98_09875 [Nannocystaceae bacterium]
MTAFIRTLAATVALSSTALFGTGCDLLDAFNDEGTTLVQLMVTHHSTPEDGQFPDLSAGEGDLRTFETDEGWTIYLQTAYVTTTQASLGSCGGAEVDFDSHWGALPENLGSTDLDLKSFGAVEVEAGSYCTLTVEYGPFVPSADAAARAHDMGEHRSDVEGSTFFFKGVAQKGDASIDFELSSNQAVQVDVDLSSVVNGGPLVIDADEAFPIDLTLSKTYDRFFDGVDFEGTSDEDLSANILAVLELETRVAYGTRVAAE